MSSESFDRLPYRGDACVHMQDGRRGRIVAVRLAIGEAPATVDVRWGNAPSAVETIDMSRLYHVTTQQARPANAGQHRAATWRVDT